MSGYTKFIKELVTKKRSLEYEMIEVPHSCSAIMTNELITKIEDSGAFTISCTIGMLQFAKALCDLEASINMMPYSIYKQLDCEINAEIPIILGRPFLATGRALVDVESRKLKFRVNNDEVTFNIYKSMKKPGNIHVVSTEDVIDEAMASVSHLMRKNEPLEFVLANNDESEVQGYEEAVAALSRLKVKFLIEVLWKHIKAIGWTIADIVGIPPGICTHKIWLDSECKTSVEHQRRLNPPIQEVVKMEVIKWLDAGVIYPIADSKWEKCHFMVKEGIVLGHKVLQQGLEVDKEKIEVIEKLPPPISVKGVCSFLGHAGFYRRFIKDFSKIAHPLCKLLEKELKFYFYDACMTSFKCLKEKLVSTPIIVSPDWSESFEVISDYSGMDLGVVLGKKRNKLFHPIYYTGKTLNSAQRNYTVTEQELLPVVYAFAKFRAYFLGTKVIVHIYHAALRYSMGKKDAKPRLIRWVLLLQEIDFEVFAISLKPTLWYADFAKYIVT
ncbi:uncharacterized protein LOC125877439 [Solanum stenotomum]|uniref:uncharacterized protein LOC125877439 n=1 Tax=Solanum stenotomum TaxID=172797 RepID=UPI0020D16377|nr:uncharacterized protein LOC125877439 [Solanum stenotomum]